MVLWSQGHIQQLRPARLHSLCWISDWSQCCKTGFIGSPGFWNQLTPWMSVLVTAAGMALVSYSQRHLPPVPVPDQGFSNCSAPRNLVLIFLHAGFNSVGLRWACNSVSNKLPGDARAAGLGPTAWDYFIMNELEVLGLKTHGSKRRATKE